MHDGSIGLHHRKPLSSTDCERLEIIARVDIDVFRLLKKANLAMSDFRTEHDTMGDVQVPAQAYYGAQTQEPSITFPSRDGHSLPH